jgi:methionine transaminase
MHTTLFLPSKLPSVGTTIFTVMSKLAADVGALNLSQGFPSFATDPALLDLVTAALRANHNQYAPMPGVLALREAIAQKTADGYGVAYHPDTEITVTSGATEALFAAITATVHPGDEVVVFEPAYDSYVPAIELAGGVPVFITLTAANHYAIDWVAVASALTERTRLIIVNTPHNPTGRVWTANDREQLAQLIRHRDIYVVADEVYEYITFDGRPHLSLMQHPVLHERTYVVGSFGKTFHITGWKIGYCLAPAVLTTALRKVHQFLTFSVSTPMQYALATYLQQPYHYLNLPSFYQQKRDLFLEAIREAGFAVSPTEGTFFQNIGYGHLTTEPAETLATRLTTAIGVASIPVSVFYQQPTDEYMLRFCFAKDDEMLLEAGRRLTAWAKQAA